MFRSLVVLSVCVLLASCKGPETGPELESNSDEITVDPIGIDGEIRRHEEIAPQEVYATRSGNAQFISEVNGAIGVFTGESNHLNGRVDFRNNTVTFTLDLRTLKTGIRQRDLDMYNTLNVRRYPYAQFSGSMDTVIVSAMHEPQAVTVIGTLFINGIERDMAVQGNLQKDGHEIRLESDWILNVQDFDINLPSFFLVSIDENMTIRIETRLMPPLLADHP